MTLFIKPYFVLVLFLRPVRVGFSSGGRVLFFNEDLLIPIFKSNAREVEGHTYSIFTIVYPNSKIVALHVVLNRWSKWIFSRVIFWLYVLERPIYTFLFSNLPDGAIHREAPTDSISCWRMR
ncbi:hypothetical protein BX666DRAFT_279799 [Dichotomocladium elegans]|nr:hypothetical protein BX666DRAFT_279799 [Dichotomocladium elegans]